MKCDAAGPPTVHFFLPTPSCRRRQLVKMSGFSSTFNVRCFLACAGASGTLSNALDQRRHLQSRTLRTDRGRCRHHHSHRRVGAPSDVSGRRPSSIALMFGTSQLKRAVRPPPAKSSGHSARSRPSTMKGRITATPSCGEANVSLQDFESNHEFGSRELVDVPAALHEAGRKLLDQLHSLEVVLFTVEDPLQLV